MKEFFEDNLGMIFLVTIVLIFAFSIFSYSTSLPPSSNSTSLDKDIWTTQKEICIKQGGIPIQSNWDGQIKECKR